jgi:hypothetical protein
MRIAYWIVTGLLTLFLVGTGVMDISRNAQMDSAMGSLGFPEYFLTIDGVAKLLAVAGILVPRLPMAREWAYAGLTFLTLGAAWSHLARGQNAGPPLIVLLLASTSRWLLIRTNADAFEAASSTEDRP